MPKRALPLIVTAPVQNLRPPPPISPLVQLLRKDWRWAGISQFLWTFSDAFGLVDWDIETLEGDLDGDESQVLPTILVKLLFALTYNRQITSDNAFENLRRQYLKRLPESHPFGTVEEPIEWATFWLRVKVQVLWQLCEWQLENPARFRALLPNEDDSVAWRIDPIGWDREGNTYYLFDDNRLWRQRRLPSPPRPSRAHPVKKAKTKIPRPSKASPSKHGHRNADSASEGRAQPSSSLTPAKSDREELASGRRKRTQVAFYGNPTSTVEALKRGGMRPADTPTTSRGTRSSGRKNGDARQSLKSQSAKLPLASTSDILSSPTKAGKKVAAPLGTRVSRRLRSVDDEWQQVPEEWLHGEQSASKGGRSEKLMSGGTNGGQSGTRGKGRGKQMEETKQDEDLESVLTELSGSSALSELSEEGASGRPIGTDTLANPHPPHNVSEARDFGDPDESVVTYEDVHDGEDSTPIVNEVPPVDQVAPVAGQDSADERSSANEAIAVDVNPPLQRLDNLHRNSVHIDDHNGDAMDPVAKPLVEESELDEYEWVMRQAASHPSDFVEWEAVCVSLYDWRTWPEQFAGSRDPDEKALYTFLTVHVGPKVIESLIAKERERIKQEAVINRKRSSRIATKELEKEEIQRREKAQREMEQRMDRSLAEERRKVREEAEVVTREQSREDRLREREERAAAREEAFIAKALEEEEAKEKEVKDKEVRKRKREEMGLDGDAESEPGRGQSGTNGLRAPGGAVSGDWQLSCEVCRKNGWNIDQDEDLVSCDDCGKWQHVDCHNRQDRQEGRAKRNWDRVDFKCQDCRRKAARKRQRLELDDPHVNQPAIPTHSSAATPVATSLSEPARLVSRPPIVLSATSLSAPHHLFSGHAIHDTTSTSAAHKLVPPWFQGSNGHHYLTPSPIFSTSTPLHSVGSQAVVPPFDAGRPVGQPGANGDRHLVAGLSHLGGGRRVGQPLPSPAHVNPPLQASPNVTQYMTQNRSAAPSPSPRLSNSMVPHDPAHPFAPQAIFGPSTTGNRTELSPLNGIRNSYTPTQHARPPIPEVASVDRPLPTRTSGVGPLEASRPMSLDNVVDR